MLMKQKLWLISGKYLKHSSGKQFNSVTSIVMTLQPWTQKLEFVIVHLLCLKAKKSQSTFLISLHLKIRQEIESAKIL